MTKKPKLINSIRAKLVSAVAMLLVAVIMVVSSTYAWFTLSTAPEVTGIQTAIGANGALEMALLPKDGQLTTIDDNSMVGNSLVVAADKFDTVNRSWGNLVDLSNNAYGLDQIVLLPSQLNALNKAGEILPASLLSIPVYGADGRVESLSSAVSFGTYTEGSFKQDKNFGVRGVGAASGMTDRQLAYRNARSDASTANAQAQNVAVNSLMSQGSTLAKIVIKKATNDDTYTRDEVNSLIKITEDLLGTDDTVGALEHIEKAYMQYVLAYVASAANTAADAENAWKAVQAKINADNATIESVITDLGIVLPEALQTAVNALVATKEAVAAAQEELGDIEWQDEGDGEYCTWSDLSTPLNRLADADEMTVNGYTPAEIKADLGLLASAAASGVIVEMGSGAGVYADIADHCGDYKASITIRDVEYSGITVEKLPAQMQTNSNVEVAYLDVVSAAVFDAGAPASAGNANMPLTEFYGYIIDLAFRTNAAESNLMLQTVATDRIYGDNNNESTLGHGSTMTFAPASPQFTDDNMKELMKHIRIVFFAPDTSANASNTGTILAEAYLDVDSATFDVNGWTAPIYLCTTATVITNLDPDKNVIVSNPATGEEEIKYYFNNAEDKYYKTKNDDDTYADPVEDIYSAPGVEIETRFTKLTGDDAKITALTQNTPTAVSALVYLDGATITNADVATTAQSMTGKMNLQFSSSANLIPMENAALHTPGTEQDVAVSTELSDVGIDGANTTKPGEDYSFKLTGTDPSKTYQVTYKIGTGTAKVLTPEDDGTYTIPKGEITSGITITITEVTDTP